MINIVNKKTHVPQKNDVYIGRPSALGNPYTLKSYSRDRSIKLYASEFYQCIQTGKDTMHFKYIQVKAALDNIINIITVYGSVNLVCWCAPLACHGSVIAAVVAAYIRQMGLIPEDDRRNYV